MDLGAYKNIEDVNIQKIVSDNNIYVPRLRGYRLMGYESKYSNNDIIRSSSFKYVARNVIEHYFFLKLAKEIKSRRDAILCYDIRKTADKYYDYFNEKDYKNFPWNRFHGKLRKNLKHAYKTELRKAFKQYEAWNKYCGQQDILYIHARIGGNNWRYYNCENEVANQPWFIEKVDDCFDDTYCDIYARIKNPEQYHG